MWKEFRDFAVKGNVLDMATGVIIGGAFGKIVTSLVNDVIMPPIGLMLGKVDFSNLFINLSDKPVESVAQAKEAGVATINYGLFLNNVLDFVIVAFVVFLVVRQVQRARKWRGGAAPTPAAAPATKECPYCLSMIPAKATRCAHCTSQVPAGPVHAG